MVAGVVLAAVLALLPGWARRWRRERRWSAGPGHRGGLAGAARHRPGPRSAWPAGLSPQATALRVADWFGDPGDRHPPPTGPRTARTTPPTRWLRSAGWSTPSSGSATPAPPTRRRSTRSARTPRRSRTRSRPALRGGRGAEPGGCPRRVLARGRADTGRRRGRRRARRDGRPRGLSRSRGPSCVAGGGGRPARRRSAGAVGSGRSVWGQLAVAAGDASGSGETGRQRRCRRSGRGRRRGPRPRRRASPRSRRCRGGVIEVIAPAISTTMPTRRPTPAAMTRRRACRRSGGAAQGGGELRVLLDEGALHLLEQSEFLFGEWHVSSRYPGSGLAVCEPTDRCGASLGRLPARR